MEEERVRRFVSSFVHSLCCQAVCSVKRITWSHLLCFLLFVFLVVTRKLYVPYFSSCRVTYERRASYILEEITIFLISLLQISFSSYTMGTLKNDCVNMSSEHRHKIPVLE